MEFEVAVLFVAEHKGYAAPVVVEQAYTVRSDRVMRHWQQVECLWQAGLVAVVTLQMNLPKSPHRRSQT